MIAVQRLPGSQPFLPPAEPFAGESFQPLQRARSGADNGSHSPDNEAPVKQQRPGKRSPPLAAWLIKDPPWLGVKLGRVSGRGRFQEAEVSAAGFLP